MDYYDFTLVNGTLKVVEYEARINDVYYPTLKEAVDTAQDGDTVVALCNIDTTEMMVVLDRDVTIDLNGYRLTYVYNTQNINNELFRVYSSSYYSQVDDKPKSSI